MTKLFGAAAALAMLAGATSPALALQAGPVSCTVGETNCVADDPDDPTAGHLVPRSNSTPVTTYNGDTGEPTTTSVPNPTPAAPSPDSPATP